MKGDRKEYGKGFTLALWSVGAFAVVHILMCLLNTCMLPTKPPWTVTSLWIEVGFAAFALLVSTGALIAARRRSSDSLNSFRRLFGTLRCTGFYLAAAWCVWSYIAFFLAMREGWGGLYHNARYLFYLTASLIVLFPLGYFLGREDRTALLHLIFDLCLLCLFIYLSYSFFRFLRGDLTFRAFFRRKFRFKPARVVFGLNPNLVGGYCAFFLVFAIYRMGTLKKLWQKVLLVLALLPLTADFIMTESRSAIIASAIAVCFFIGTALYRRGKGKGIVTVLVSLLIFLLSAALFIWAYYVLRKQLNTMRKLEIYNYTEWIYKGTERTREFFSAKTADLTGRRRLWAAVITGVFGNRHLLLHGCTQSSTATAVSSFAGMSFNTHNQILEVLLAYGLPAAILFLLWLFWVAGKSLSLSLTPAEKGDRRSALPLSLLLLITINMAETMLVGRGHFVGGFFFLIAGYAAGMAPSKKPKE